MQRGRGAERERERDEPHGKVRGSVSSIGLCDPVQPWKGTKEHPIPTSTKNEWENRGGWEWDGQGVFGRGGIVKRREENLHVVLSSRY